MVFVDQHSGQVERRIITLDVVLTSEADVHRHLGELLGAPILSVSINQVDLVRDLTTVDVRYATVPQLAPVEVSV